MAPKTDKQNKEIRKKSKQKIIDASIVLFSESGYSGTSISKIATKAKVSKGLIYNYFDTKEDIVKGIVESLFAETKDTEIAVMQAFETGTPNEVIDLMLNQTVSFLIQNKQKWKLVTLLAFKMNDFPYIHDIMVNKYAGYIQLFTELFEKLGYKKPKLEAQFLAAQFDGIAMQYLVFNDDEYPLEEIFEGLKNKYKQTPT